MARIRYDGERLIELFAEVALPSESVKDPSIVRTYPEDYSNKEVLSSVPYFACPCSFKCDRITHFSFVLTNIKSKWTFGYCRHTPESGTCLVLLSDFPWHSTFYKILDQCAELSHRKSSVTLERFLEALYNSDLPQPGLQLTVTYTAEQMKLKEFNTPCPDHLKLPCIPEDRNITEYFNAITPTNMIVIFASMLNERRIVMTSDRLNRLSACVQAANALIYPMHWQHIFIPLLPSHLLDYLSAPMPFLIGVPQTTLNQVKASELGEIVMLNADTNHLVAPFDDVSTLPSDVLHHLRKSLKQSSASLGDGLCRAFMRALVMLIGGYRDALRLVPGEKISFDREAFVSNVRGTSRQLFLEKMLQLQIFQQFIESRLDMFNQGERFVDQFEIELNHIENTSNSRFKTQYREWATAMRKEGGALLRAVNPKVKSVFSRSRQAVRNLRAIITLPNSETSRSNSAPSSPKLAPKMKKSISGNFIPTATSRTITYVRTPQSITTSSRLSSTSKKSNGFVSKKLTNSNVINGVAPSASSESSDIDDGDFTSSSSKPEMSIKEEIDQMFSKKMFKNENGSNGSSFNNNDIFVPIPPPRTERSFKSNDLLLSDEKQSNSKSGRSSHLLMSLIEFDSPPKETHLSSSSSYHTSEPSSLGALLFDPLLEQNEIEQTSVQTNSVNQVDAQINFNKAHNNNATIFNNINNNFTKYKISNSNFFVNSTPTSSVTSFSHSMAIPDHQKMIDDFSSLLTRKNNISSKIERPTLTNFPQTQPTTLTNSTNNNNNPFQQPNPYWQKFD